MSACKVLGMIYILTKLVDDYSKLDFNHLNIKPW